MKARLWQDGWMEVTGLPGWDTHTVTVKATIVDGEPRVTSLRLDVLDGADAPALTGQRLRSLPMQEMALLALRAGQMTLNPGIRRAMAAIASRKPAKHDPRASTTAEQVAEVWLLARESGKPPRAEVVRRLHITDRTADRYIKKARASGLLPVN